MADSKIDAFTEDTAPLPDDVIYVEHDPAGTPANRKVRIKNLRSFASSAKWLSGPNGR